MLDSLLCALFIPLILFITALVVNNDIDRTRQRLLTKIVRDPKTEEICFDRYNDKLFTISLYPISIGILLLKPSAFLSRYGGQFSFLILVALALWFFIAWLIGRISQKEDRWGGLFLWLNAFSGGWLITSIYITFNIFPDLLK